jgi:uncharacterized protein (TIGR00730 family)
MNNENTPRKRSAREQIPVIMSELQTAAGALERLGPAVSLFGSARMPADSPSYGIAQTIAAELAQAGLAVIAGGGPGLMEAANKGAFEAGGVSVGLNIWLRTEPVRNAYQTHRLDFQYFYSRKATFFLHSMGYVVLPGGFGTVNELFDALLLIQTGKLPAAPIILVGSDFWNGLAGWMRDRLAAMNLIDPDDMRLFSVVDDPALVVQQLLNFHGKQMEEAARQPPSLPA